MTDIGVVSQEDVGDPEAADFVPARTIVGEVEAVEYLLEEAWLEEELKTYNRILVLVSHSQDFLNSVCTNIIHVHERKLKYYGGNYDSYVRTRAELEENQMKQYQWEQDKIAHMKDYIARFARFGHGSAKLARQAQSKEKTLHKMVDAGLTERVTTDKLLVFSFPDCGKVPPPVIMVLNACFKYGDGKPLVYKDLDFGIDHDTRVALVGPNGAGKSTLLKLIDGELTPPMPASVAIDT